VKAYLLERFAEELARELLEWPPPFVDWVSEELRRRWAIGAAERPRDLRLPEGLGLPHRLTQSNPRLFALTVEDPLVDPVPVLNSQGYADLVAWGREHFDWVLIDSPPAALVPDANMLAQLADGVILVVWASSTPRDAVERAIATVGHDRLLGVVLNRVTAATEQPYLAYYGAYVR
jgi:hypothetical protein